MASLNEVRLIGYVETRKRTDNEGQDHYTTEVAAEDLQGFGARWPADGERTTSWRAIPAKIQ